MPRQGALIAPVVALALLNACTDGTARTSSAPPPVDTKTSTPFAAPAGGERCAPDAVRSTVDGFLDEAPVSPERAVEEFVAPEPDFQWFSGEGRVGPEAHDRDTLAGFLKGRSAGDAEYDLEHFQHNGVEWQRNIANFEFRIQKSQGATSSVVPGKGAVDCDTGRIVVWSEGASPPVE